VAHAKMSSLNWSAFRTKELPQAKEFAMSGGIAVHMGWVIGDEFPKAPTVFKNQLFAHLLGPDEKILTDAAISIGCKVQWVQKRKTWIHYDLVCSTLHRALKRCPNGSEILSEYKIK
jgi:hypothetical protein